MAGGPTFPFSRCLFKGGTLVITKLFNFSTDTTRARLEFVLNRSLSLLVYIQNLQLDKQSAAVLNGYLHFLQLFFGSEEFKSTMTKFERY